MPLHIQHLHSCLEDVSVHLSHMAQRTLIRSPLSLSASLSPSLSALFSGARGERLADLWRTSASSARIRRVDEGDGHHRREHSEHGPDARRVRLHVRVVRLRYAFPLFAVHIHIHIPPLTPSLTPSPPPLPLLLALSRRFSVNNVKDIPHPAVDWRGFVNKIKELNAREPRVFDPIAQQMKPWIDTSQLARFYVAEASAARSACTVS